MRSPYGYGLTPIQLHDAMRDALARTAWSWRHPFRRRRYAIWLTLPYVVITRPEGTLRWDAVHSDQRGHGFTRRQARQIVHALRPVLAGSEHELRSLILAVMDPSTPQ